MHRYEEAIDLCHRIGDRHGEGVNLTNLANLQQATGAVADALDGYDRAARIFAELGNRRGEAMVLVNSAWARHTLLGEDERARADATSAIRNFGAMGDRARKAQCEEIIAGVEARAGRLDAAKGLLESSVADLGGTGNAVLQVQHLRSLALLVLLDGDGQEALATLDSAETICLQADLPDLAVELTSIKGLALQTLGDLTEALRLTREAVSRIAPGVERPFLIHHRHAMVAESAGEKDEARSASLTAHRLLSEALAGLEVDDFQRAISRVPEHRDIVRRAERFAPNVIEVELPAVGTPTGRPLERAEVRVVKWTVDHPDDELHSNDIDRRRARLLRILAEAEESGAAPTTEHLANALSVSSSTIRRDLHALRADGHSLRTRGQRRTG